MFNPSTLTRVPLKRNVNFKREGLKNYAGILQKYNIAPTIDGPFAMIDPPDRSSGQKVMNKINKKFGGKGYKKGQTLVMRDAAGKTSQVSAQNVYQDSEYIAEVTIGKPAQKLNLNFDTGSADLWVWSNRLPASVQAKGKSTGHNIFNIDASSTWKNSDGQTWEITYGDGSSASGGVGTDNLTVGGMTVQRQAVETASTLSPAFEENKCDGLLGLAWGQINTVSPVPAKTPVENMILQDDIPKTAELFTAYLGSWRDKNNPDKGESFYTFGYIDPEPVKASGEDIHYVNINNSQGFWQFSSPTATVAGRVIDRPGNEAIADTGTTLALLDDKSLEQIYAAIPGARKDRNVQAWVFPTSIPTSKLPTLQFAVGTKLFTVLPEDLQYAKISQSEWYGGVQSRGDIPFDILGDTFLKNVYAIFDQGNKRFGCVQRYEPGENYPGVAPAKGGAGQSGSRDDGSWSQWFNQLMQSILGWLRIG